MAAEGYGLLTAQLLRDHASRLRSSIWDESGKLWVPYALLTHSGAWRCGGNAACLATQAWVCCDAVQTSAWLGCVFRYHQFRLLLTTRMPSL